MMIAEMTDIGKVRESNQDAYKTGVFKDGTVWAVVCDGMGGVSGGQIASSLAVKEIASYLKKNYRSDFTAEDIRKCLTAAVASANAVVLYAGRDDPDLKGMGTTVVAAIVGGGFAMIAHVGDSRAYLIRDKLRQVTKDHSVVQYMIDTGRITADEAKTHPDRNIITRAVGSDAVIDVETDIENVAEGDVLLICTDGLTGLVSDEDIFDIVKTTEPVSLAEKLVEKANNNGGRDNITVVAVAC